MENQNNTHVSKFTIIKFIFFGLILLLFIGIAVIGYPTPSNEEKDLSRVKDSESSRYLDNMIDSLERGDRNLKDSRGLLDEVGIHGDRATTDGVLLPTLTEEGSVIHCPQYLLPIMPKLPVLPSKEVLDSVTKDQLNFILYAHIKEHQERTVEVRKRMYRSYAAYLESCE